MPGEITLQQVHDELRTTHEEFKKYVDKGLEEVRKSGEQSAETTATIEKINTELTELRKSHDELAAKRKRPSGEMLGGTEGRTEEEEAEMETRKASFNKFLRQGTDEMGGDEKRALSSSSDADGGFLTPVDYESELITYAHDDAAIRPLAQVGPTSRDTVQLGAISKPVVAWGTQNLAVSPQDLQAGGQRITIYDLRALTLIHNNTLDDAEADVWGELVDQFSMAVAEAEDLAHAVGAGNKQPQGVMANDDVLANFKVSGHATLLNGVEGLIDVLYSLKKTYRRNATWAMNSLTESEVRKLRDDSGGAGTGQFLWQPPVQAGAPATLLGRPLANPEGMPDIAANSFPVVCGDFRRGYKIRDRAGLTIKRLDERYSEYDQVGFILKRRTGGQVTQAEAFSCLKIAA